MLTSLTRYHTLAALLFVLIWSTGFIVARGIRPLADPSAFLALRFLLCVILFSCIAFLQHATRPTLSTFSKLVGIGMLLQGVYLVAGFWAVGEGLQPGIMALLGAMQPPLSAALASYFFNESLSKTTLLGLSIGFIGVCLAVWPNAAPQAPSLLVIVVAAISIIGITAGTLLQKTGVANVPIILSSAIQNVGALIIAIIAVVVLGETHITINSDLLWLLAYAVLVLSLGGTTLLIWLVRSGSMASATSLLFLTPPLAAVFAYWIFSETLSRMQVIGFGIAILGVWLARQPRKQ